MAGLWTNYILPHLIESGAIGGPAEAGKKTLLRLRWLFIVAQMGGTGTQQRSLRLGNRMLMDEDFFGESDEDGNYADEFDDIVNTFPADMSDDDDKENKENSNET